MLLSLLVNLRETNLRSRDEEVPGKQGPQAEHEDDDGHSVTSANTHTHTPLRESVTQPDRQTYGEIERQTDPLGDSSSSPSRILWPQSATGAFSNRKHSN